MKIIILALLFGLTARGEELDDWLKHYHELTKCVQLLEEKNMGRCPCKCGRVFVSMEFLQKHVGTCDGVAITPRSKITEPKGNPTLNDIGREKMQAIMDYADSDGFGLTAWEVDFINDFELSGKTVEFYNFSAKQLDVITKIHARLEERGRL